MRRVGSDAWGLLGMIVVFGVMAWAIAGRSPQMAEVVPHRTTYSNRPGGFKAAYLLLKQRGVRQVRLDRRPAEWPKAAQVVIAATPFLMGGAEWDKSETKDALRWVEAGNTLVVACDAENDLTKTLKLVHSERGEVGDLLAPRQPLPLFGGVTQVKFPDPKRWSRVLPHTVTLLSGKARVKPGSKANPDELPGVIVLRRGKGRIIAVSSPGVWENRTLDEADNARFLVQLVESQLPAGASLGWDEYHQGYAAEQSFWTVIGSPGQLAIYQIIAVSLIAVYAAGRRFGLPRPLGAASRVSSEYVASLADLYRRARASDAALLGVYQAFRRDLCRTVGAATDADDAALAHQAASLAEPNVRRETEERLRRLLADAALRSQDQSHLPRRERTPLSEADMLRLAREMESFRKELGIGRFASRH